MPRGVKAIKPAEDSVMEEEVAEIDYEKPKAAIEQLIVKLCNDVTFGRSRDEFKALEAIAELYNAVK